MVRCIELNLTFSTSPKIIYLVNDVFFRFFCHRNNRKGKEKRRENDEKVRRKKKTTLSYIPRILLKTKLNLKDITINRKVLGSDSCIPPKKM